MIFCYVLAGPSPRHLSELRVSLISLRLQHPSASIYLLTHPTGFRVPASINSLTDRIFECEIPGSPSPAEASRVLKTTLRQRVDGHLVYLDTDTLILGNLAALGGLRAPAAVFDRYFDYPVPPCTPRWILRLHRKLGWREPIDQYFNSGVTVWPDSDVAHALATDWHQRWKLQAQLGILFDQIALNAANVALGHVITQLDDGYNALIDADPRLAIGARVVHFFSTPSQPFGTTMLTHLTSSSSLNPHAVATCVETIRESGWSFSSRPWSTGRLAMSFAARAFVQALRRQAARAFP